MTWSSTPAACCCARCSRVTLTRLFAIFSNPEVMRYWSTPPWTSPEPGREMVAQRRSRRARTADHVRLGLVRLDDDTLIGTCTLFDHIRQSRRAEVGYGLARACWGLRLHARGA